MADNEKESIANVGENVVGHEHTEETFHDCLDEYESVVPDLSNGSSDKSLETDKDSNCRQVCEPCHERGITSPASNACDECEEALCDTCSAVHKSQKATKQHTLHAITEMDKHDVPDCERCREAGKVTVVATKRCVICDERLCNECVERHLSQKATKNHDMEGIVTQVKEIKFLCEDCSCNKFCIECKQELCNKCTDNHTLKEPNKRHRIIQIVAGEPTNAECGPCRHNKVTSSASKLCKACNEYLCDTCCGVHRGMKATKDHKMKDLAAVSVKDSARAEKDERHEEVLTKPGKPQANGRANTDSITLTWDKPQTLYESHLFQVRYRDSNGGVWKFYDEQPNVGAAILKDLKADSKFIFQVRMMNNEMEGPYSDPSDEIKTPKSASSKILPFTYEVQKLGCTLTLRKIPLTENQGARSNIAKTRKFDFGKPSVKNYKEKTIMLVGETGSGKSTLVDGIVNYVLGVNWNDPYRLTLVDLEDDEKGRLQNQAISQTQWITCYAIHPDNGGRLDYKLNIIDTPGFGDTRGIERDHQIMDQIGELFSSKSEKGVVFIDAVCFLIKAPDARLTPTQKYIFNAILSMFGQDIEKNICILITFADGKSPPVLSALKEANMPNDLYFLFNNSGLFAENDESKMQCLSPMFWEMGSKSFGSFFYHLSNMETKSLDQTKEVLSRRKTLELTIENLQQIVDVGLYKLDELQTEIRVLEQHKTEIEANKNFTYVVTETKQIKHDLPNGKHVTNCLNCNFTCHKDCRIPKDEDKHDCTAMDGSGNCTQCSDHCHWSQHVNTPYIFEYVQEYKSKTYAEKEDKYRIAKGEKMTHEKVIDRMEKELSELENSILQMMDNINECNNVLKQIALRPNPLSLTEHIDLLIENEKLEKGSNFQDRIKLLQAFKRKTVSSIGSDVAHFQSVFESLRQRQVVTTFRAALKKSKSRMLKFLNNKF